LRHPATGKQMAWVSPLPADLAAFLARLRRQSAEPGAQSAERTS
jgi:hypothetical protein